PISNRKIQKQGITSLITVDYIDIKKQRLDTNVVGYRMKMKETIIILVAFLVALASCKDLSKEEYYSFTETHPSFFELRHGDWTKSSWIRKPANLLMVHETFKKVGYANIITPYLSDNPLIIQEIYIKKNPYNLIDSLLLTYNNEQIDDKYYREFWARRKKENNDSIVFQIIKDIKFSYKTKFTSSVLRMQADSALVNDTLYQLINIEYRNDDLTSQLALQDIELLKKLGFHQSAYNLLFENSRYSNIDWDRENLSKDLKKADNGLLAWFADDTK
ncbi:hypothetical protein, partial [Botryobacter ruber]|uniref:hypothetical protein n=1 Tax=Botryobacter ruber TaxID=2171629 RepID=UPI0013E3378B